MALPGYVFVTGSSRGIGRAIVLRFASEGYAVAVTYRSSRDKAEKVAEEARKRGAADVLVIPLDVTDPKSVEDARRAVEEKWPYLNVLVNNAGILHVGSTEETSLEDWEKVIKVNLTGVFLVTKTFLPLLRKAPWASIVNIASIAGQTGNIVASTAYAASKAGVIGFTRRLAVELAPYKIRVNAVAPSFVETDMVRDFIDTPEKRKRIEELHPLKTIIQPEDVAEAVYFLASPAARTITGQVLGINAGRLTC
ncbi:SDR family oxidoreductase [Pyrofollis japonicus]|uniref:SDR family NAD(P)-dependent oxidoreductase n=1 Tax=Pyrofollis japonicus TaxID=3060460 RepID=UPI00295BE748|nr:3-oxoacyl-ACP reductase family protein [Pyrofollis japonicus]BEP17452.1 SDR family oxidoreductase [Pyrofollis japonicus]